MINKIKDILNSMTSISSWHIEDVKSSSSELFFVKQEIDMSRFKDIHNFTVTVYTDFEEESEKYKGSSTALIYPTMDEVEIKKALEEAAYASTFVKNQFYPILNKTENKFIKSSNTFNNKELDLWMPELSKGILKSEPSFKSALNSAELFLTKNTTRIQNSNGVDVSYENYDIYFEFVTNSVDNKDVESFKQISFSDYTPDFLSNEISELIEFTNEKTLATSTPSFEDINVIITGEHTKTILSYYTFQSNASSVYNKLSTYQIDDKVQGDNVKGDFVTIKLDPNLSNSTFSSPFDSDGLPLKKVSIIEKGILKSYWGSSRYSHYLNISPVGNIKNVVVDSGSKSIEEMKEKPYLELLEFSDFQMNPLTGDFAGEIRLGRYFDGNKIIPVTTGSISGNIKDIQSEMYLSKEIAQYNNYKGPKSIQLLNMKIAGN